MGLSGLSWRSARLCWTHCQVPGSTCITPRALAAETIPLLKPLSCQAIAEASEAGTPLRLATIAMSAAVTRPGVGAGDAAGTTAGAAEVVGTGAPVGSFSGEPAMIIASGDRPFMNAICWTETPERAARALRVSPE